MVHMDVTFFAVAVFAVMFAGLSKGGFGSGAAFAAAPILALIVPPGVALGLMLPLLMLVDLTVLRPYWRRWHGPTALLLIAGAVPGVGLGMLLYRVADPDLLRLLIGCVALGFVGFQLAVRIGLLRPRQRAVSPVAGAVAGVAGGFTSFISHAGGPPVAVYLLAKGLDKTTYQATTVLVFWAINIVKFIPYAMLGVFTRDTLVADLYLAPFALLGAWLGVKAHRRIPEGLFFGLTYVLLVLTGGKLIWDALS